MQSHTKAVNQCRAYSKARRGDITSKRKVTLTNQKPDEKQKWYIVEVARQQQQWSSTSVIYADGQWRWAISIILYITLVYTSRS